MFVCVPSSPQLLPSRCSYKVLTSHSQLVRLHRKIRRSQSHRRILESDLVQPPEGSEPAENRSGNSVDRSGEMTVLSRKKWPRDNRDKLPFDVYVTTPPPYYLGQFMLDPRAHNGDILEYQEHAYVIKRTRLHYYYRNGEFRVGRKSVDVNTVARSHINNFLDRIYSSPNTNRSL